jgi:uncharacterized membrane protein
MPAHEKPIESHVAIKQHPLHPVAVVFPTAFLIATLVTDLVYWWHGDDFWAQMSFWLVTAGFTMGVLAALLGLADFLQIKAARDHVAGWSHLTVAIMTLSLAGASVQLRIDDPAAAVLPWGVFLSVVMTVLVAITGWLGGTLTFRHGIGTYVHELDEQVENQDAGTGSDDEEKN